jgi:RHS repeat-associated protein
MPAYLPIEGNLELVAVYAYDAFNRRVQSILVGIETQVHTWDGWRQVVQHGVEFTGTAWRAAPTKQFVWGARLDELVSYRRKVGSAWETYYVLHGGQDTAVKLVDSSGAVVEQYEYDPYGRVTVYTGSGSLVDLGPAGASPEDGTASAKGLPFLWKGIRLDEVTGLLQMRNRYYSVEMGRFLTRDPLGVWSDIFSLGNEHTYGGNRPLSTGDPDGLQTDPQWHHIVPQAVTDVAEQPPDHRSINGIILPEDQHGYIHGNHDGPDDWNVVAKEVDKADPKLKEKPDEFLKAMKARYAARGTDKSARVLAILDNAVDADMDYSQWGKLCSEGKKRHFKKLKNAAMRLAKAGGRMVKAIPGAGMLMGTCDVASAETAGEAILAAADTFVGEIPVVGSVYDGAIGLYHLTAYLFGF